MKSVALSAHKLQAASSRLKLMAHPARLAILCRLVESAQSAGQLQAHTTLSQSAISQHLGKLRSAKLVKTERRSQSIIYSIADDTCRRIISTLHDIYCSDR